MPQILALQTLCVGWQAGKPCSPGDQICSGFIKAGYCTLTKAQDLQVHSDGEQTHGADPGTKTACMGKHTGSSMVTMWTCTVSWRHTVEVCSCWCLEEASAFQTSLTWVTLTTTEWILMLSSSLDSHFQVRAHVSVSVLCEIFLQPVGVEPHSCERGSVPCHSEQWDGLDSWYQILPFSVPFVCRHC